MAKKIKHFTEYVLLRIVVLGLRILPLRLARTIGIGIGCLIYVLLPKRRNVAEENLSKVFSDWPHKKIRFCARRHFEDMGRKAVDFFCSDRLLAQEDPPWLEVKGMKHLEQAYASGKGVMAVAGHIGMWELGSMFLSKKGFSISAVAKPMKNRRTDTYINRIRSRFGQKIFLTSQAAMRESLRVLKRGEMLCLLIDQRPDRKSAEEIEFLGRSTRVNKGPAMIAAKTGCYVLPSFMVRTGPETYTLEFTEPFILEKDKSALKTNLVKMSRVLESLIRNYPEQWLWCHKRW